MAGRRISTGIPGLDKLVEGGFLSNSVILVSGSAGAGKSIFGMQFLKAGAEKKEKVLYISTEESVTNIKNGFKIFGWDLDKLKIDVISMSPDELEEDWVTVLNTKVDKEGIKRIVIDSVSLIGLYYKDEYSIRRYLYRLISSLKERDVCCILVSEIPEGEKKFSRTGVAEFVADGVIVLEYLGTGSSRYQRGLTVRKMRWTQHNQDIHPYKIVRSKGIVLSR
jgi:KaiC/GvpD/RAD55 family RecA-like ATPase